MSNGVSKDGVFVVIQNNRCGIKPLLGSGFVIYGIISLDL